MGLERPLLEGGTTTAPDASVASTGSLTATWTVRYTPAWPTNGPLIPTVVNFGYGTPAEVGYATSVPHTYRTAGPYTVDYYLSRESGADQVAVGADYTPVSPNRILDTRIGTGTGKIASVGANGTLTLSIPTVDGVPADDMSAVVMNDTVTSPTKGGNLTVYPGAGSAPTVSNLNFSAGETVPNLVTTQVSNGQVSFHNNSGGYRRGGGRPGGLLRSRRVWVPAGHADSRVGHQERDWGQGAGAAEGVLRLNLSGKVPAELRPRSSTSR